MKKPTNTPNDEIIKKCKSGAHVVTGTPENYWCVNCLKMWPSAFKK